MLLRIRTVHLQGVVIRQFQHFLGCLYVGDQCMQIVSVQCTQDRADFFLSAADADDALMFRQIPDIDGYDSGRYR